MENNTNRPNGGDDDRQKKQNRRGIIICLAVAIGVFIVFSMMNRQVQQMTNREITYDKFIRMLDDGQVKSVTLTADRLKITPKSSGNSVYQVTYYTGASISRRYLTDFKKAFQEYIVRYNTKD